MGAKCKTQIFGLRPEKKFFFPLFWVFLCCARDLYPSCGFVEPCTVRMSHNCTFATLIHTYFEPHTGEGISPPTRPPDRRKWSDGSSYVIGSDFPGSWGMGTLTGFPGETRLVKMAFFSGPFFN